MEVRWASTRRVGQFFRHARAQAQGAKAGANHGAARPGGPRAAPDRRRASPGGALTAVPAFASAPRVLAPEHRRRREFAALRASRLRAGEEGGGAGTAAPRPTRAPEGRGQQGDARAAAGRQGAAAGRRYARTSAARPRCAISRARFLLRLQLPSILLFAETTINSVNYSRKELDRRKEWARSRPDQYCKSSTVNLLSSPVCSRTGPEQAFSGGDGSSNLAPRGFELEAHHPA